MFDSWRHRFTIVTTCATAALLFAGGLVTSTGSGLAVPDWPLSFGRFFPPMVGGVLYEHGHRMVAGTVAILTIILAVWYVRRERRTWVRRLAIIALAAVFAQALLGGLTVLLRLPPAVSVAHACLAQTFFCLMVILSLVTSRGFLTDRGADGGVRPPAPHELAVDGAPSLVILAGTSTALIYGQLILGAVMRHTGAGLAIPDVPLAFGQIVPPFLSRAIAVHYAHRVTALLIAVAIGWTAARVLRRHRDRHDLVRPARLAMILVVFQILLGALTVATRLAVLPATVHLLTGALLLATSLVLTVRASRRRVLLASVVYLPALLALMVVDRVPRVP
jgi:cytochrome c oxidase assembly protein subunit 15